MDLNEAVLPAIALMVVLAGLLAVAPSRNLGIGVAAAAVVTGLAVAVLSAGFARRPTAVAQWPKISTARAPVIRQADLPADDRVQLDLQMLKENVKRLTGSEQRLLAQVDLLTKDMQQVQAASKAKVEAAAGEQQKAEARLRTEVAERLRQEAANRDLAEALKKTNAVLAEQAAHAATRADLAKSAENAKPRVAEQTKATEPAAAPPSNAIPVTSALVTVAPVTVAPVTVAPVTIAPVTSVPTPAASPVPVTTAAVAVPQVEQTTNAVAPGLTRDRLEAGITAPSFVLKPLPDQELVAGKTGSYYSITLNNPATGKPFTFEKERYVLAERDADFLAAAAALRGKLADALQQAGVVHALYVRGFAGNAPLSQSRAVADSRAGLKKVSYLRQVAGSAFRFNGPAAEQVLTGPYLVSHLPLLRAAAVRELLAREIKRPGIEVVGGELKPAADPQANTFEIILYAVWP